MLIFVVSLALISVNVIFTPSGGNIMISYPFASWELFVVALSLNDIFVVSLDLFRVFRKVEICVSRENNKIVT